MHLSIFTTKKRKRKALSFFNLVNHRFGNIFLVRVCTIFSMAVSPIIFCSSWASAMDTKSLPACQNMTFQLDLNFWDVDQVAQGKSGKGSRLCFCGKTCVFSALWASRKEQFCSKRKKKRANHAPYLALYLTGFEYSSAGKHWKSLGRSWRSWSHHILLSWVSLHKFEAS